MNFDSVAGYLAHGEAGATYLILHEIGHMWAISTGFDAQMWSLHQADGGTISDYHASIHFARNEIFANQIAHRLANHFGESIMGSPPFGYIMPLG